MKLYHGSSKIIKMPQYGIGNPRNDYGLGFYCTKDLELAKEWACPEVRDGFANMYDMQLDGLNVLDLQAKEYHVLNWLAILLKNRIFVKKTPVAKAAESYILNEFLPETEGYDVICGYRADDSYFSYAKDFLNNAISVEQLDQAMRLGELGKQVAIISERAMQRLVYEGYVVADSKIYYAKRMNREKKAREKYLDGHGNNLDFVKQGLFVLDIMRSEVKNDDERLFRTIC